MDYLLLIFFLFAFFLLRIFVGISDTTDEWVTFWLIEKQNKHRWLNYAVSEAANPGIYPYPQFPHFLVSRLPRNLWGPVGKILNASCDLVVAVFIYAFMEIYLNDLMPIAGLTPSLAAVFLFLTLPILLPTTSRMLTIKGRSLGFLLTSLYFIFMGFILLDNNPLFILPATIISFLVILSSMFGLQVIIFFSIGLGILYLSVYPFLPVLFSILIAYLFPQFGAYDVLKFFWHHKIYYQKIASKGTTAAERNKFEDLINLPKYFFSNPRRAFRIIFKKNSFIIAFYSLPELFILLASFLFVPQLRNLLFSNQFFLYVTVIVFISLFTFLLISFPSLSFLGQAERYFEYSSPFICILFIISLDIINRYTADQLFWVIAGIHFFGVFTNTVVMNISILMKSKPKLPSDLKDVGQWIKNNLENANILTVPIKLSYLLHIAIADGESARNIHFYYRMMLRSKEVGLQSHRNLIGGFIKVENEYKENKLVPRLTPVEISEQYGISHILIEKDPIYIEGLKYTWRETDLNFLKTPIYENDTYSICKIANI